MRHLAKVLGVLFLVSLCAVALAPLFLYHEGLSHIPRGNFEAEVPAVSEVVRSLVWAELGGEGAPVLEPLNPYSYFSIALNPIEHAEASGSPIHMASPHRLAARAGRTLVPSAPELGGGMGRWHLTNVAATIWVSRNWSASRAIDHVAGTDYYGHGFVGLPAASAGYFGLEPTQLSPPHAAMLVVIPKRPGRFSPWCFYHANIEQASRLVVGPWPELKPAPPDTCRSFAAAQQEPTADAP